MWRNLFGFTRVEYIAAMNRIFVAACMAILFAIQGSQHAQAMSCDNRGATDRLHYGSHVSGDQVTICAEYWWPPVVGKPVVSPVKTTTTPVKPNSFVVTPLKPKAFTASPHELTVGQVFSVQTSAAAHQRKNTLLGRLAIVRFTPTRTSWNFGDGARGVALNPAHKFKSPGTFRVQALVYYGVKFRFVGTTRWILDPRGISLQTNFITFKVSVEPPKPSMGQALLVLFDCFGSQRKGC